MSAIPHSHGHLALPFGRFYGREDIRRSAPGLELSLLQADPHRIVERHSHEEAHVVLVLDGLYVSTAEGAPPVSAGAQLIFNPAGTTHRDRFEARNRVVDGRFMTISLAADIMRESASVSALPERAVVMESPAAMTIAMRLSRVCAHDGGDAPLTRHALALELLSHVAFDHGPSHHAAPAWLRIAHEHLDDAVSSAHGGATSITEIARVAGVHPVHLSRVFRQHVGVSPADYVRRRRLEQSRTLLRCTARPLSDIALSCGFSDQSHFSNAFRAAHGVTPSAFRAAHGE